MLSTLLNYTHTHTHARVQDDCRLPWNLSRPKEAAFPMSTWVGLTSNNSISKALRHLAPFSALSWEISDHKSFCRGSLLGNADTQKQGHALPPVMTSRGDKCEDVCWVCLCSGFSRQAGQAREDISPAWPTPPPYRLEPFLGPGLLQPFLVTAEQ